MKVCVLVRLLISIYMFQNLRQASDSKQRLQVLPRVNSATRCWGDYEGDTPSWVNHAVAMCEPKIPHRRGLQVLNVNRFSLSVSSPLESSRRSLWQFPDPIQKHPTQIYGTPPSAKIGNPAKQTQPCNPPFCCSSNPSSYLA